MSRNHLIVEGLQNAFRIRDVGSSNGTFVNNLPISVVELCDGDHIKAGTSVFEVVFSSSDADSSHESNPQDLPASPPARTLSVANLKEFQDDVTMRYEFKAPASVSDDRHSWGAVARNVDSANPADALIASVTTIEGVGAGRPLFDEFLSAFIPEVNGVIWKRRHSRATMSAVQTIDWLQSLNIAATCSLIVNRSQLEPQQIGALEFALSTGEATQLTETLFLLASGRSAIVLEFYKRCLAKDAAVCIVSDDALSRTWLDSAIDVLSYPSMFADLVRQTPGRGRELCQQVHFLLFEPQAGGELCLLRTVGESVL